MGGMQDKRHQPGKGREEQIRGRQGQDPVQPGARRDTRGLSPEELEQHRQDEMSRDRDVDPRDGR
ncbi:hypothetical protein [Streptomyces venezuelae]|uniref:hypothetical protein n=1 Tax=Streptomyces venezuelae TaxID=54571 RepID=UPI00278BF3F5|nr:hypothetical protein [Streptomyces venezuelae]